MKLNKVSLVCVDGKGEFFSSIKAIENSIAKINFNEVILITSKQDHPVVNPKIKIKLINKMTYSEYNEFILCDLYKFFESEYVLLIQDDGYVRHHDLWRNDFLDYDYIGAPWPEHLIQELMNKLKSNLDLSNNKFSHNTLNLKNFDSSNYRVGNGGFSLRSKRLCEFTKKYKDKYINRPEDNVICIYEKEDLINNNFKIAPVELASKFSSEFPTEYSNLAFGFHRF